VARDALQLIRQARLGKVDEPVHVLVGTETFLIEQCIVLLRRITLGGDDTGFNADVFHGRGLKVQSLLSAARTLPMFAPRRFVLLRDAMDAGEDLDELLPYLENPAPSTCLVLTAEKLDGRSRFAKAVKKLDQIVEAAPLRPAAVRSFVVDEARHRGHDLAPGAAAALADTIGTDLAAMDDALERLSLYVGPGQAIDQAAVEACIARVRVESIWALVDAVSARDDRTALRATASLLADREAPLRILSLIARQLRMVARMREALASGLKPPEAAQAAGAPPFKASELAQAARRFNYDDLKLAFEVLADADLQMKGGLTGNKVPAERLLEGAIMQLCRPTAGA
jgi:DNA polymerase-3 subunit delta